MLSRFGIFLFCWWIINGGDLDSIWLGVLATAIAAYISTKYSPKPNPLQWSVIPRFIYYFLINAFVGSFDVAKSAFKRELDLYPGEFTYVTYLSNKKAKQFFIAIMGLLPGTLCINYEKDTLLIHSINSNTDVTQELHTLENLIADLFGEKRI